MKQHLFHFLTIGISFFIPILAISDYTNQTPLLTSNPFTQVHRDGNGTLIVFDSPEIIWQPGEGEQELPFMEGAGEVGEAGGPRLPVYNRLIAVPSGMEARLGTVRIEWSDGGRHEIEIDHGAHDDAPLNAYIFREVAQQSSQTVTLGATNRWRDIRFAPLILHPMRYDAETSEIEVASRVEVEIEFIPGEDNGYNPPGVSEALYPIYTNYIIGARDELDVEDVIRGSYLIIVPPDWDDELEPLIEWRTRCGYEVIVATTTQTGTTTTSIHNYIDNIYEIAEPALDYVLLVGDTDAPANIATYSLPSGALDPWVCTDHKYTYNLNGGNDLANVLPRYHIGRISVDSATEVVVVVNKILQYERTPQSADLSRFERATMVCTYYYTISTRMTKEWVHDKLLAYGFSNVSEFYQATYNGPPDPTLIGNDINAGVSWVNYRGFGSYTGWEGPYFRNNNVAALNNTNKLPVVTSMVCGGGSFDEVGNDPCFGEMWIRTGTPNNLRGAVAFVGPSELDTHTKWNNCVDGGWYRGMLDLNLRTMGECLLAAKMELYNDYPGQWNPGGGNQNSTWFYFHIYNTIGDPALQLRTEIPLELTVEHPNAIFQNTRVFPVYVEDPDGAPVENARVVIADGADQIVSFAITGQDGRADVIFESPILEDEVSLTITRPDVIPYTEDFDVDPTFGFSLQTIAYLEDEEFEENNGDDEINPGELILPQATFHLNGVAEVEDLTITISLPMGNGEVEIASEDFGMVAGGETITLSEPRLLLDSDLTNQAPVEILFSFEGTDFQQTQAVVCNEVAAPMLRIVEYEFTTDWEPGDEADLSITLANDNPHLGAGTVTGVLTSVLGENNDFIDIVTAEGGWDDVPPGSDGEEQTTLFRIAADEEVYPGREIPVQLTITTEEGYLYQFRLGLAVEGVSEDVPTGPCSAGYYFYEDNDVGYDLTPEFEYVSINNVGTNINVTDGGNNQDRTATVDIPFEFPYWDDIYEEITVCSNGWFSFGETDIPFFRNRPIPGALSPNAAVAVFWDDLKNGTVYTYHDNENGCFIIEWYNWVRYSGATQMRFQARLLDPAVWGSPGGLGMILLMYNLVDNNDAAENYCTVGIISPDGTEGLEYEFNNVNPPTAAGLVNNRQIMIAVGLGGGVTPAFLDVSPQTFHINLEPGETLETTLHLQNTGGLRLGYNIRVEGIWHSWQEQIPGMRQNGFGDQASGFRHQASGFSPQVSGFENQESKAQSQEPIIPNPPYGRMQAAGGPDNFGYVFYDSDEPTGGPIYDWLDIARPENEVEFFGEGSGSVSGPLALPFQFPFYGIYYDTLWVCESGYVVLIDPEGEGDISNSALPHRGAPYAGIFAFWGNVGIDEAGTIYAQAYSDSFVVSYNGVRHQSWIQRDGPYTFQILLTSDGAIHLRYEDMNSRLNMYTIGIQNHNHSIGLQVIYMNQPNAPDTYIHNGLAIRLSPPPYWMEAAPTSGYLLMGEEQDVRLSIDTEGLEPRRYEARMQVYSRSTQQSYRVPITLTVLSEGLTIPLRQNYFELISSYLVPPDLNAATVFGDIANLAIVYQNNGNIFIPPTINTIGNITITQGYQIFCTTPSQLTIEGELIDPETFYSLETGHWNWLGYPFPYPVSVETAFSEVTDQIVIVQNDEGGFWIPRIVNTLHELVPGCGYFIFARETTTFQYNPGVQLQGITNNLEEYWEIPEVKDAPSPTGLPYIVLVRLSDDLRKSRPATIEIFDQQQLVGKAIVLENKPFTPVVAWGGVEAEKVNGFTPGHPIILLVREANGDVIPIQVDVEAVFGHGAYADLTVESVPLPLEFAVGTAYPNPFNPSLTIPNHDPPHG